VGLTLIRKSDGVAPKKTPRVALVLAGGAVSGGAFKVGGLKALNDFLVERKITDMDLYVGLSAGAILGSSLSAGVTPDEMIKVLDGTSTRLDQLRPLDFYNPNFSEFAARPAKFAYDLFTYLPSIASDFARALPGLPDAVGVSARDFVRHPSYTRFETVAMRLLDHVSPKREIPALTNHIPSGFFDNASLERWLRNSLEKIKMPNDFRAFARKRGRKLYITACDLDTAERTIFGPDENSELTISQAVQASTALPIFYKPARLNGVDYVDGGVRHTANIDIAIEKGADLIICYNPFRPFLNRVLNRVDAEDGDAAYFAEGRYLADRGLKVVINQVFRTLLHSRLKLGIQRYLTDDRFQGDIVLLEPRERDADFFATNPMAFWKRSEAVHDFFATNPMAFWKRSEAVQHGFESVRMTIEQNYEQLAGVRPAPGSPRAGPARTRIPSRNRKRARCASWAARSSRGRAPALREDAPASSGSAAQLDPAGRHRSLRTG
jgi:predicted acylesterase/phospholipase RssA